MDNKKIRLFSKSFILGLGLLLGITSLYAITVSSTKSSWGIEDFDIGKEISQNMLIGQILGYTCYNTTCSQKVYWKKIDTTTESINQAAMACESMGMVLPSADQMGYYGANNRPGLNMGTYTNHNSMTNAGSQHWTSTKQGNTSLSCSTPGYSCDQYVKRYPNSWNNGTNYQDYGYSLIRYYCVYKRWY